MIVKNGGRITLEEEQERNVKDGISNSYPNGNGNRYTNGYRNRNRNLQSQRALPDLISLNTVLSAFVRTGNSEGARKLFDRIKNGEFRKVISNRRPRGDFERNVGGNTMAMTVPIHPDVISYNSLLSTVRDPNEAVTILDEVRFCKCLPAQ